MRSRLPLLASAAVAAAAVAVPATAGAAPHPIHDHALSIHSTQRNISAGDAVDIYGRLTGRDSADQTITLYHRIFPATGFTRVGSVQTNAEGQYVFVRAEGVVNSTRRWYVVGPVHSHSKTITEHVAAEVSVTPTSLSGTTRHPITFTGSVVGGHAGAIVRLQQQNAEGNVWRTIAHARLNADGTYSLSNRWRTMGERNVRVAFGGDAETTSSVSDPVSIVIEQRQAPYFTIGTTPAIVAPGTATAISGTLYEPHTTTPEAGVEVALYTHLRGSDTPTMVGTTTTDSSGGYSFPITATHSAFYQARTVNAPVPQATAAVFQGVRETVTLTPSATSSTVGGQVTFSGTVSPADVGAAAYLERLGRDGHWQVVGTSTVQDSGVSFAWTFGAAGTKAFRVHVVGGPMAVGGWSPAVSIDVAQPPASQLPSIG